MRTRLILLAILVLAFLYWRGFRNVTKEKGLSCEYHVAYAICSSKGKTVSLPGIWDILKAGAKF